jgi:nicotinamidase-related amidase
MQNYFFQKADRRIHLDEVTGNINRLIDAFDAAGLPVFHILSAYRADGSDWDLKMKAAGEPELIEGTPESAILPGLYVRKNHFSVTKTRYSAFFKTNLADELHDMQIERAVVTGAYTHYCVNATIFDAYGHDLVPCLITDAVLSHLQRESAVMVERMRRNGYHLFTTDEFLTAEFPA